MSAYYDRVHTAFNTGNIFFAKIFGPVPITNHTAKTIQSALDNQTLAIVVKGGADLQEVVDAFGFSVSDRLVLFGGGKVLSNGDLIDAKGLTLELRGMSWQPLKQAVVVG